MAKKQSELEAEVNEPVAETKGNGRSGSIFTNMKIVIPVLCVAIVVLLSAVLVQALSLKVYPNNDPRGTITVIVADTSNNLVKDAEVTLLANGRNARTNAEGVASFRDLPVGNYMFRVSKKGFATMDTNGRVDAGAYATETDTYIAEGMLAPVTLLKTSATVSGYATVDRLMANATTRTRLGGAEMMLVLDSMSMPSFGLVNTVFKTTANAQGEFEFKNLPEGVRYTISGEGKSADGVYNTFTQGNFIDARRTAISYVDSGFVPATAKELVFSTVKAGQFAVTSDNRMSHAATGNVTINFSENLMPTTSFAGGYVTVKSGSSDILVTPSASNNALTLALVGSSWYAEGETTATITLTTNIKSSDATGAMALPVATTITLINSDVVAVAPEAAEAPAVEDAVGGTLVSISEPAEGTAETLFAQWNYVEGVTYEVYLLNEDGTFKKLNLTATKVEIDNGLEDDDFEIVDTVWRVNLVGALGTAAELRALEEDTTYKIAVIAVQDGVKQSVAPLQITITLDRA